MLRAKLATLNAICPPGNCHAYQNVAYDAASEIVEKVTGKPYREVVQEQLFQPLGMTSASADARRAGGRVELGAARIAAASNSKPVEVTDSYYRVPAAGGVNSSIKDLAHLDAGADGRGARGDLGQGARRACRAPRAYTPGELARKRKFRERLNRASYGLGWRIYDYAGHRVIGHHGGVTGYRSLIMFDPDARKPAWSRCGTAAPTSPAASNSR